MPREQVSALWSDDHVFPTSLRTLERLGVVHRSLAQPFNVQQARSVLYIDAVANAPLGF